MFMLVIIDFGRDRLILPISLSESSISFHQSHTLTPPGAAALCLPQTSPIPLALIQYSSTWRLMDWAQRDIALDTRTPQTTTPIIHSAAQQHQTSASPYACLNCKKFKCLLFDFGEVEIPVIKPAVKYQTSGETARFGYIEPIRPDK